MDAKYKQYKLPQQDVSVQNTMADLLQDVPGIMARLLAEEVIMIKDEISSREASTRLTPAFLLSALIGAGDIDQAKIFIQMFPDAKRMLEEFIVTAPRMRKPTTFLGTAGTEECKNGIKILHDLLGSHALDGDLFKMLNAKNPVILSEQEKEGLLKSFVIDYTNLDLAITPQIKAILDFKNKKETTAFQQKVSELEKQINAGAVLNLAAAQSITKIINNAESYCDMQKEGRDAETYTVEKTKLDKLRPLLQKHLASTRKRGEAEKLKKSKTEVGQLPELTQQKTSKKKSQLGTSDKVDTNAKSEFYTEIKNDLDGNWQAKIVDEQADVGQENDSSKTPKEKSAISKSLKTKTSKLSKTKTPKESHSNFNNASNLTYEALSNILLSDVSVDSKNGSVSSTRRAVLSKSLPSPQDILTAKHQDTGDTPLHAAIKVVDLERVRIFLNAGFKLGVKNGEGKTALHLMIEKQLPLIVLERALQIEAQSEEHQNHHGESGGENLVRAFDIQDKEGNTPLHIAANNNITSYYAALVGAGADVNAKNNQKSNPINVSQKAGGKIALEQMESMNTIFSSVGEDNIDIATLKALDINLLHYFRDFTSVKNSVGQYYIEAQGKLRIAETQLKKAQTNDEHPEETLSAFSKELVELQRKKQELETQLKTESSGLEELRTQKQTLESSLPQPQAEQQQSTTAAVDQAAASTEKPENTIKKEIDALGDTVERKVLAELLTRLLSEYSKQTPNTATENNETEVKEILSLIAKLASYYVNDKVQNSLESAGNNVFKIKESIGSIINGLTANQQSQKDLFEVVSKHIFSQQAESQGESGVPSPQDEQKTTDIAILAQFIKPSKTPETIAAEAALEQINISISSAEEKLAKTTQELASVDGKIGVVEGKIALKTAIDKATLELTAAREEMEVAELMRIAISKQDSAIDAPPVSPASPSIPDRKKSLRPSSRSGGTAAQSARPSSQSTTQPPSEVSALSANSKTPKEGLTTFSASSENYTIPEEPGENDLQNNVGQEAASTEDCKKQMTTLVNLLPKPKTGLFSKAPKFDSAEFNEALTQLIEMGGINTTITQSTKRGKDVERGILHIIIRRLGSLDKNPSKHKAEKECLIEAFNKIYSHPYFQQGVVSSSGKSIGDLVSKMGDKNCQQALNAFISDAAQNNITPDGSRSSIDPKLADAASKRRGTLYRKQSILSTKTSGEGTSLGIWSKGARGSQFAQQQQEEKKKSQATAVETFYTKLEEILNVEGNPSQEQLTQLGLLANIPNLDAESNLSKAIGWINYAAHLTADNVSSAGGTIEALTQICQSNSCPEIQQYSHLHQQLLTRCTNLIKLNSEKANSQVAITESSAGIGAEPSPDQGSDSHENNPSPDPHDPDAKKLADDQQDKGKKH